MAKLEVTGSVKRIFFDGKGIAISEAYTAKNNETKHREYTAWFNQAPDLRLGDIVIVEGRHGAVIELWTNPDGSAKLDHSGKQGQSVRVSLNDAQIVQIVQGSPAAPKLSADEMPF